MSSLIKTFPFDSNLELVELFILNGIGINIKDSEGKSALDLAIEKEYIEIVSNINSLYFQISNREKNSDFLIMINKLHQGTTHSLKSKLN